MPVPDGALPPRATPSGGRTLQLCHAVLDADRGLRHNKANDVDNAAQSGCDLTQSLPPKQQRVAFRTIIYLTRRPRRDDGVVGSQTSRRHIGRVWRRRQIAWIPESQFTVVALNEDIGPMLTSRCAQALDVRAEVLPYVVRATFSADNVHRII